MLLTPFERILEGSGVKFGEREYGEDILARAREEENSGGGSALTLVHAERRVQKEAAALLEEYEGEGNLDTYIAGLIALHRKSGTATDRGWFFGSEFLPPYQRELFYALENQTNMPFFWREGVAPNQLKVRLEVDAINEEEVDLQREYRPIADQLVRGGRIKTEEVKIILPDLGSRYEEILRAVHVLKFAEGGLLKMEAEATDALGLLETELRQFNDAVQRVVSLNGAGYDPTRVVTAITPLLTMNYRS